MKRPWLLGIGIALSIGAVFWMRALASWRPVVVGKVSFAPAQLKFSRDGRFLLAKTGISGQGSIVDLKSGAVDSLPEQVRGFDKNHGLETYPRLWRELIGGRLLFSPARGEETHLRGTSIANMPFVDSEDVERVRGGWSKALREVYGESQGSITIWNWNGQLKKRVDFAKTSPTRAIFSSDGTLLLTVDDTWDVRGSVPMAYMRLYDVQTGNLVLPQPNRLELKSNDIRTFGFSSDEKMVWYAGSTGSSPNLVVTRIADPDIFWSGDSQGAVRWLPDNRVGIVADNGFDFRDASGHLLQHLPGPFQRQMMASATTKVTDWTLSPDSNWIYAAEQSGIIRRWRAR